ncbi:unnamed protein product [Leptidea sinapis]|uniref:Uncharacterized protein n=1 Tax=Leptidea sinapis TaxID=189913 RepID=A0A5E4QTS7_9NEOP|nr:unnamed protein product [Leptidea sinapis]
MDIAFTYNKKRFDFGKQPLFCEQGPEMCDTISTNVAEHKHYILRNPVHQPTQNTPVFSKNYVNTVRAEYTTTGINHAEGGWPKDVNVVDPEATQRYRRRIEKEDNYIHCVMGSAPGMEHYVFQNNAIDMYRTYYAEMATQPAVERSSMRNVNVYRDASGQRPITSVCWQPEGGHYFSVTYTDVDFNHKTRASCNSYIWNVENANNPEIVLTPSCPLVDLQFNGREREILAGGLMNGQVGVWDRRVGGDASLLCAPHVAHREFVRNVLFVNAKSGQEFFSGGPDGVCKWWDMRNMEAPIDEMIIDVVKSSFDTQQMQNANGISALEFEQTIPTRFMVGTENGFVIGGNRKGKTPMEKLPAMFPAHLGPVWRVERNPNFLKNFLTVGDWCVRVWSEECRESSIMMSPPQRHKVTSANWSPTRLSLMLVTRWDGLLSAWDLLRRQHEPALTMHVCDEPLLTVKMHETMFDRESKRERILEARMREIRLKLRQAEEGIVSPQGSLTDMEFAAGDKDLYEATTEYMQTVKKELASM